MNRKNRFNIDEEYKPFKEEEPVEILEPTQEIPVVKKESKKTKEEAKPVEEPKKVEEPIRRGCMIQFNGNKSYSGLPLSAYTGKIFRIKELSGDRAVIAKGSEVIAAVNIKDCVRV